MLTTRNPIKPEDPMQQILHRLDFLSWTGLQVILWYLGITVCSKHMTGNRSQLMNFVSKFLGTVRFGNDQIARIMGYGYYQLGNVIISRVYYVEGLGHNLFSVGSRDTNLYTISLDDMLKTSPICLLSKASKTKSWLWHRRLSHLNFGTLNKLAKDGLARGIPRLKFQKDHLCSACALGKSKKSSHQPKAEDTNQEKLYLLHMDLCGPMRVASINGKRYILVIVDDYSRFTWVRFLRTKDEAPEAIIKCIKNIQVCLNATVRNVRTDNGTEFVNQTLHEFYENVGISHQTSVARTPQQNGVVERRNRTLVEAARTMLIFSKAPLFLWAEAINTACYTQNRSLIRLRYNKTPYELMQDKKLDLSFFHVFGSLYYPTNDNDDLGKLDAKADIVMASEQFSSGLGLHSMTPATSSSGLVSNPVSQQPFLANSPVSTSIDQDAPSTSIPSTQEQEHSPNISQGFEESPKTLIFHDDPLHDSLHKDSTSQGSSSNVRQTHTPFEHLGKWTKDHPIANVIGNPSRYVSTRKQLQTDAMWCYFDDRVPNFELVSCPDKVLLIKLKWIYKVKMDEFGGVLKNKARLVAQGFRQEEGIDFEELFALDNPSHVYKLKKALYGLKQAPRAWYDMLSSFLISQHFSKGAVDPTLFTRQAGNNLLLGKPIDATLYRGMIGSLMYLTSSRPDLIYVVCLCSRYQEKPTEKHLNAVKRIFRYLKGTINIGLWYSKDSGMSLTAYADANHAGCQDTRRSTSRSAQFLGDKLVSWSSKKQKCTAISNTSVLAYNKSSEIAYMLTTMFQAYSTEPKHIEIFYHFIKEQVENEIMEIYFVRTEYQLADIFTKPLPRERFNFLIEKLGMRSMSPEMLKCLAEETDSDSGNSIMSSITAQQTKLDLELVPKENRLDIRKCNGRIPRGLTPREPTFQVVLDAIALTPCYPAFLINVNVPEVYMHQFWNSVYKHDTFYRFKIDKKKQFKLTLEVFRDIFQICLRVSDRDFDPLPSEEDIVSLLR
ncbi:retrovirus-related pol polyprotein from transposon TNT 1-94 [Tanacetum coccineum]|uniref:Retrovirus-related pol polyprotein from transposon TNT 1-94 n=1 Tax=Tanacetum coccineum TaxID=301880 RepID=A0ABQ5AHA7_9ASTR